MYHDPSPAAPYYDAPLTAPCHCSRTRCHRRTETWLIILSLDTSTCAVLSGETAPPQVRTRVHMVPVAEVYGAARVRACSTIKEGCLKGPVMNVLSLLHRHLFPFHGCCFFICYISADVFTHYADDVTRQVRTVRLAD